nr:hypothetical protein [Candidatus Sigynarchaeota archaeon]
MQPFDVKRCGVAIEFILKVIGRMCAEHDLLVNGEKWNETRDSTRAAIKLLVNEHGFENENGEDMRAKLLHRAIMHVLTLFIRIDDERYPAEPESSILYHASESIRRCIPQYEIADYKAELLEQAEICREKIEQFKEKCIVIANTQNEHEPPQKKKVHRNLLSFANPDEIDAYQARMMREKLQRAEKELQLIQQKLDTVADGFNARVIARFIHAVMHSMLPSSTPDLKSHLSLAFALTIAFIKSKKTVSFIGDLAEMMKSGFQMVLPIPNLDMAERNELARINEVIEATKQEIAEVKAQLQDSSLDLDEKHYLISTRDRLGQKLADDSHRKLELEDRLRWKEPKEQGKRNATILIDAITHVAEELIRDN